MGEDRAIRQRVLDELELEPGVDATGVTVTVESGIVTLAGHVPLYRQRLKAEEATWRVGGVRALVEEIDVWRGVAESDEEGTLAARVLERLDGTITVPDGAVRLKVQNGWVMLYGELERDCQRQAAAEAVRSLVGVDGLVNQIRLKRTRASC